MFKKIYLSDNSCTCKYKQVCYSIFLIYKENLGFFELENNITVSGKKIYGSEYASLQMPFRAINSYCFQLVTQRGVCDVCEDFLFELIILTEFDVGTSVVNLEELENNIPQ